jgi:hypothetical protein
MFELGFELLQRALQFHRTKNKSATSNQPVVFLSQNKSATNNQPTVFLSQNKSPPATSDHHLPNEHA